MIRKLCITDREQYLVLLEQLTSVGNISESKWTQLFQKMEGSNIEIYVLVKDLDANLKDIILAAGTLLIEPKFIHEGSSVGHIEDVVVAETARGLGLGKKIVEHLVKRAKELGAYKVILDTKEDTVGFYNKMGFHKHEVQMRIDL
jgi:glucosamine-phosphate N-acetyltransferase